MAQKPRARELGIPLPGQTGTYNAITDVPGVEVGFSTIQMGVADDYTGPGSPFARTGVTAILPRGKRRSAVFAGRHNLNGNGEMTGTHWIDDSGFLHTPVMITNTNSVGVVRDTVAKWMVQNNYYYPLIFEGQAIENYGYFYPVVGETWDGVLNDINGFHVEEKHALEALENAKGGEVAEGCVGGGTGMVCHGFKGGTGTSSRIVDYGQGRCTVGALVQANHGTRELFEINGVSMEGIEGFEMESTVFQPKPGTGSIIVVLATDAPLLPLQLSKLCRRATIGIGRLGSGYESGSGDIFLAFSTANDGAFSAVAGTATFLSDEQIDPLYKAVADAVEEAILNAMCAAETTVGIEHTKVYALPTDQVTAILKKSRV